MEHYELKANDLRSEIEPESSIENKPVDWRVYFAEIRLKYGSRIHRLPFRLPGIEKVFKVHKQTEIPESSLR